MDALLLRQQATDVIKALASNDVKLYDTTQKHLAQDAVLDLPIYRAQGPSRIHDAVAVHAAFTAENTVGDIEWDDENKTATIGFKTVYVLPVSEAPWPLRVVGWIKVPVKWEGVTFKLSPEANEMEQSGPSKYHISKISKAARAPRYRILAAPYHAIVFLVRLVAPYALGALAIVVKFFLRNPLRKGIIRTHVAAVRELVHWLVTAILSRLSFTERPATDVPGIVITDASPSKTPDVDTEEKSEAPKEPAPEATETTEVKADVAAETAEETSTQAELDSASDTTFDIVDKPEVPAVEETIEEAAVEETPEAPAPESSEVTIEEVEVVEVKEAAPIEEAAPAQEPTPIKAEEPAKAEAPVQDKATPAPIDPKVEPSPASAAPSSSAEKTQMTSAGAAKKNKKKKNQKKSAK